MLSRANTVRNLWRHPLVRAHLGDHPATLGRSIDDALEALAALGHVRIDVEQGSELQGLAAERPDRAHQLRPTVRYRVTVAARESAGEVTASGETLTEAALRCLLDVASELRDAADTTASEAQRYITELERIDSQAGLDELERYLAAR